MRFSRIILPVLGTLLLVSTVATFLTISATAFESAKSDYDQGKKAEARQDYIAAYEAFAKAYQQKPEELKYRVAFQRTRFLASSAHVNKGQVLRGEGKLAEALAEFEYAAKIDPSSFVALQEVKRTKALIDATQNSPGGPQKVVTPHEGSTITRRLDEAGPPVELAAVSTQPITLEISNTSNVVYETLGKLAGINVLLDPDYTPRRIVLKLNGVSLREALDIVAFHSNTFWRPVTRNTIYVASNTAAKRKELEQNVLKTFYLSNVSAATELQDVTNTLRSILEIQKVQQVNSQNAIIVRGTPDQVALAEKIIGDIDKAKPEVIVEVAIMQVRRDKLRDLGISPPTSISAQIQPFNTSTTTSGTTTAGTTTSGTTTSGTTTSGTTTSNGLTLNTFGSISDRDIALSISSATANFLLNDSNSRLIQNPQIRASDGQKASLKIGDRVPIATGSFGGGFVGAGVGGANGLVNTQFQYIDVGVNIDITPRVFNDREVGLKLALDVSQVTGTSTIGGVTQPIISQRKIEHDIRLKEGEINLLGGIFEETDSRAVNGIPGLAQLPFLKYFFSTNRKEKVENEIVFILVPHIVRDHDVSALNQRELDVGTGSQLDLRRISPPPAGAATPAPQAPAPITQTQPQAAPANVSSGTVQSTVSQGQTLGTSSSATGPMPVGASAQPNSGIASQPSQAAGRNMATASSSVPAVASASPGAPSVRFDPSMVTPSVGSTFSVNVIVSNVKDLYSAPMQISYDPAKLQLMGISNGDMLSRDGQAVALVHREEGGTIQANATRPPSSGGVSGDGVVYTLTFQAKSPGNSTLTIGRPNVRNSAMQSIQLAASPATISVQ